MLAQMTRTMVHNVANIIKNSIENSINIKAVPDDLIKEIIMLILIR